VTDARALLEKIDRLERQVALLRKERGGGGALWEMPPGDLTVLPFRVGDQRLAVCEDEVLEVVMAARLQRLPESPAWLRGALNLRGEAVPVVDVDLRLGGAPRSLSLSDRIVIVRDRENKAGLLVHEVEGVLVVPRTALLEAPPLLPAAPFVLGLMRTGQHTRLLLSVGRLLAVTDAELDAARSAVLGPAPGSRS
jgi:purine-binding chemotaxis protein CheW